MPVDLMLVKSLGHASLYRKIGPHCTQEHMRVGVYMCTDTTRPRSAWKLHFRGHWRCWVHYMYRPRSIRFRIKFFTYPYENRSNKIFNQLSIISNLYKNWTGQDKITIFRKLKLAMTFLLRLQFIVTWFSHLSSSVLCYGLSFFAKHDQ